MQQLSLLHLFAQLASLICTIVITCIFLTLLALCMQQRLFRRSSLYRVFVGLMISAAMLIASPVMVYRRPRQHMAIGLATMSYMAALTMLDWCLLQPSDTAPSVRAVLASFVWQPMSGIISAYKAKQKTLHAQHAAQHAVSGSSKARPFEHQPQQQTAGQLLHDTVSALIHLMVLMDIVSAILQCWFCYGDLSSWRLDSMGSGQGIAAIALGYLIKGIAGFLLGMQLAATYMGGRIVLLFLGYQDIGPVNIFDRPWMATSISDLWSNRWHQVLRYYFTGLGYSLADQLSAVLVQLLSGLGCSATVASGVKQGTNNSKRYDNSSSSSSSSMSGKGSAAGSARLKHQSLTQPGWQREIKRSVRTIVVFAMSGLVHEYVVWAAFGVVSGKHLAFFMLHGVAVLAEGLGAKVLGDSSFSGTFHVPMWLRRVWVLGFAFMTCPLFVDVLLQHRHYQNYVPPFIVPVTTVVLESLGLCKCT